MNHFAIITFGLCILDVFLDSLFIFEIFNFKSSIFHKEGIAMIVGIICALFTNVIWLVYIWTNEFGRNSTTAWFYRHSGFCVLGFWVYVATITMQ